MAENTVKINFKATGNVPLEKAIKSLDKATKSLIQSQVKLSSEGKKVSTVHKQTTGSTNKLTDAQKKQTQRTRILGGSFAVLRSKLLIYNFAMGLGIRQTLKFAESASRLESVSTAFNTLTGSTNATFSSLNKLQQATNDTVSEIDLLTQANNALILGVTNNTDEMAEMFDIAQRLGRALGRDTASSVESLITGIGRQSRLMLDNIGIIVKSEEAYEAFAKANGTTADKLTDAEKKQAFFNATMESARAKVSALGAETLTSQDVFDQFSASMSNLASAFGGFVSGGLQPLISGFTNLANSASDFFRGLTESPLETTIRQLKDLGAETESLMQLQKIQLQRNVIKLNQELNSSKDFYSDIDLLQAKIQENTNKTNKEVQNITSSQLELNNLVDAESKAKKEALLIDQQIKSVTNNIKNNVGNTRNLGSQILQSLEKEKQEQFNILLTSQEKQKSLKESIENSNNILNNLSEEGEVLEKNLEIQSKIKATEAELLALGKERATLTTGESGDETGQGNESFERSQELRKIVFGKTVAFQIQQLEKLKSEFDRIVGSTVDSEKYFADERMRIENEHQQKINSLRAIFRNDEMQNEINAVIEHGNQMLAMRKELGLSEIEIAQFVENRISEIRKEEQEKRKEIATEELENFTSMVTSQTNLALGAFNGLTGAMEQDLQRRVQNELNALKSTNRYKEADAERRKTMEHQVHKRFAQEEIRLFKLKKVSNLAQIAMDTASAVVQALPNIPLSMIIGAMGLAQAQIVASQPPPSYETGGLVGGNRHSQGGTIIEAERGEFVMSRNAVQSLGVEAMNEINQGRSMPSVNINISAPLVDDSVVDSIIPAINKALRNGRANIGA